MNIIMNPINVTAQNGISSRESTFVILITKSTAATAATEIRVKKFFFKAMQVRKKLFFRIFFRDSSVETIIGKI